MQIGSEDCLHLNVTTPTTTTTGGGRLPVVVWIPGGGFVQGSSASQVLAQPNGRWDYHDRGFPWVWGPLMVLFGLGLIALVVWLIVRFARPHVRSGLHRARELLAERYARGEISSEEYDERMNRLKD